MSTDKKERKFNNLTEYIDSLYIKDNPIIKILDESIKIYNPNTNEVAYTVKFNKDDGIFYLVQTKAHTMQSVFALSNIVYPYMVYKNIKKNSKQRIKIYADLTELELSKDIVGGMGNSQEYFKKHVLPLFSKHTGLEKDYFRTAILATSDRFSTGRTILNIAMNFVLKFISDYVKFKITEVKDEENSKKELIKWLKDGEY